MYENVSPTGALRVSDEVREVLYVLADELAEQAKVDPLAAIEETCALLHLLGSGSWGEGTRKPHEDTDEYVGRHRAPEGE